MIHHEPLRLLRGRSSRGAYARLRRHGIDDVHPALFDQCQAHDRYDSDYHRYDLDDLVRTIRDELHAELEEDIHRVVGKLRLRPNLDEGRYVHYCHECQE